MNAYDRRRFLRRAALAVAAGGMAAAGGALGYRAFAAAGRDTGDAVAMLLAERVPRGAAVTVLAADADGPVYSAGFGESDRAAGTPAGTATVYDIGSVTKQFTAAAIMRLVASGEIDTGEPVRRLLPGLPEDKGAITVHQLLTHTSGLVDSLGDDYAPLTRDGLIAEVAASAPLAPPGERYAYSNVGYGLLAAIVETATSMSYEEYLSAELFTPAGMRHTGYLLPEWDRRSVAVEYAPDGSPLGRPDERGWDTDGPYWNLRGNGGLLSTAEDMLRWHHALDGGELLPPEAVRPLFTPHVAEDDSGTSHYGYGWVVADVDGVTVAWHNGGNGSSYAEVLRVPGGPFVFWATNTAVRSGEWNMEEADLANGIGELLLKG
ncbi:CubicO group peptidase (beta-lactamase class C family) [Stackebrandtia albiflava]|uniref:CubicO group peptidase (Beta-lactamase class C family) n=1 Tax=Stackebrandtia albiflava TaxID=406432 RepID=A0A562VAX4_9ACTN|nr:serine hydrolase domain-containing protein [Stackebrandtia albiflava]TWJ14991.1 CubicO group peptidase (beta-lactamase class C family) [Stackebrandtia albiflava]